VALLDRRGVGFEYDGEMSAECRPQRAPDAPALSILPARRPGQYSRDARAAQRKYRGKAAARSSAKGRLSVRFSSGCRTRSRSPTWGATVSDLVNLAALSAHDAIR